MNERGTYGNGHGYSPLTAGNGYNAYQYPALGADVSPAIASGLSVFFLRLSAMLGGAVAGHLVSESKHKGVALGAVGGYFTSLLMEQTGELKRINEQLAQR